MPRNSNGAMPFLSHNRNNIEITSSVQGQHAIKIRTKDNKPLLPKLLTMCRVFDSLSIFPHFFEHLLFESLSECRGDKNVVIAARLIVKTKGEKVQFRHCLVGNYLMFIYLCKREIKHLKIWINRLTFTAAFF